MDGDGNPVYGSSGTGIADDMWWTTPYMVAWTCLASQTTELGPTERWVLDSPGSAHIWLSAGNNCESSVCSSPMSDVSRPDIPCSCSSVWGDMEVEPPHWLYGVYLYQFTGWSYTFDPATSEVTGSYSVAQETRPIWDLYGFSSGGIYDKVTAEYLSSRVGRYYVANYQTFTLDSAQGLCPPDSNVDSSRWSAAHSSFDYLRVWDGVGYFNKYFFSVPDEGVWTTPGESATENMFVRAGTLYQVFNDYWDYNWDTGETFYYEGFTSIPITQYSVIPQSSTYAMSMQYPYAVEFDYDQWGHIEGSAGIDPNSMAEYITINYVREARGASCAMQDVPVSAGVLDGDIYLQGSPMWHYRLFITTEFPLEVFNSAYKEWAMGGSEYEAERASATTVVDGYFCPMYWFQQVGVEWAFCPADPLGPGPLATGEYSAWYDSGTTPGFSSGMGPVAAGRVCSPVLVRETAIPNAYKFPLPDLWYDLYSYGYVRSDSLGWLHEVDDIFDESGFLLPEIPFRQYSMYTDGHAYAIRRLSIDNYPTWFTDGQCAESLNAAEFEVGRVDYTEAAQSCSVCERETNFYGPSMVTYTSCYWPYTPRCMPALSHSCGYRSQYGPIYEVPYPNKLTVGEGTEEDASKCRALSVVSNITELVNSVSSTQEWEYWSDEPSLVDIYWTTVHVDLDGWFRSGDGCPDWQWGMAIYYAWSVEEDCIAYSAGSPVWLPKDRRTEYGIEVIDAINREGHPPNIGGPRILGAAGFCAMGWDAFGWEGDVFDPLSACGTHEELRLRPANPIISTPYGGYFEWSGMHGSTINYSTPEYRYNASLMSAGAVALQWPQFYCDEDGLTHSYYVPSPDFCDDVIMSSCMQRVVADEGFPNFSPPDPADPYQSDTIVLRSGTVIFFSEAVGLEIDEEYTVNHPYVSTFSEYCRHGNLCYDNTWTFYTGAESIYSYFEHSNYVVSASYSIASSLVLSQDVTLTGEGSFVLPYTVHASPTWWNSITDDFESTYSCVHRSWVSAFSRFNSKETGSEAVVLASELVIYRVRNIRHSYCFSVKPHDGTAEADGLDFRSNIQMCMSSVWDRFQAYSCSWAQPVWQGSFNSYGDSEWTAPWECSYYQGRWSTVGPFHASDYQYKFDEVEFNPEKFCGADLASTIRDRYMHCTAATEGSNGWARCTNEVMAASSDQYASAGRAWRCSRYVSFSIVPAPPEEE